MSRILASSLGFCLLVGRICAAHLPNCCAQVLTDKIELLDSHTQQYPAEAEVLFGPLTGMEILKEVSPEYSWIAREQSACCV